MDYITIDKIKKDLKGRNKTYLQFLGLFLGMFLFASGFYLITVLIGIADIDKIIIKLK